MEYKMVSRIVERTFANHGKPLTRSTAKDHVNISFANIRFAAYFIAREVEDVGANRLGIRKVELVRGAMNGVNFNSGSNVDTSLLKA